MRIAFRSDGVIEGNVFHSEERFFSSFKIGFGLDVNYKNLKKKIRSAWDSNPKMLAVDIVISALEHIGEAAESVPGSKAALVPVIELLKLIKVSSSFMNAVCNVFTN